MIRDKELERLEHYAQGLGVAVVWSPYVPRSYTGGGWSVDGSQIEIFTRARQSKLLKVLILVHELAHHLAWVYNGRVGDLKTTRALEAQDANEETKEQRKLIYLSEKKDAEYRQFIYREVGLKIPEYIFKADLDLDIWIYYRYYKSGKFPTHKNIRKKKKELRDKYAKK